MKYSVFFFTCFITCCLFAADVKTTRCDGKLILENGITKIEILEEDFSILQISNIHKNCLYMNRPGGSIFTLHTLIEGEIPPAWYELPDGNILDGFSFSERTARPFGDALAGGWQLCYSAPDWELGDVSVMVEISMTADSALTEWNITIRNASDQPLHHLEFPCLSGMGIPGAEAEEFIAVPVYSGHKAKNIRKTTAGNIGYTEYPSGGMTIQMFSYEDGAGNAFYFAAHDGRRFRKTFMAAPDAGKESFYQKIIHYPDEKYICDTWHLQYPVVLGPVEGDWYDSCKIYRSWAITQDIWQNSLANRDDIPQWLPETPVWFQGNEWSADRKKFEEFTDSLVFMREKLGYPMVFHWYLWQKYNKHDYAYPDYLPARDGFKEAVAKVHDAGIKVFPYLNIHLCETQLPLWRDLDMGRAAKRNSSGMLWREYGLCDNKTQSGEGSPTADVFRGDASGKDMVPMCLSEDLWQDFITNIASVLINEYAVDGIYWDETFVYPGLCYANTHFHDWIGGSSHADGIRNIHAKTRAITPDSPLITAGENLGEAYTDVCPILINAHSDGAGDSLPLFQTVHSDHVAEVGLFVNRKELYHYDVFASKLAFNLLRGRILGWFNTDQDTLHLTRDSYAKHLDLLKHYCDVRLAGLPWLYYGEMLRSPDLSALPQITKTWSPWPSFQDTNYTFPVVNGACYRAPDNSIGIILANITGEKRIIQFPWNSKDWGYSDCKLSRREYRNGQWHEAGTIDKAEEIKAELEPYEAIIIAFAEQ